MNDKWETSPKSIYLSFFPPSGTSNLQHKKASTHKNPTEMGTFYASVEIYWIYKIATGGSYTFINRLLY